MIILPSPAPRPPPQAGRRRFTCRILHGRSASVAVVRCAGDVGLSRCEATRAALINALAVHDEVLVDCREAERIDVTFVQLLLAAHRSAQDRGRSLRLAAPATGALLDALVQGGFLVPDDPHGSADAAVWRAGGETPA